MQQTFFECLFHHVGHTVLIDSLVIFSILHHGPEGGRDQMFVEFRGSKAPECVCPVDCFGDPRGLVQVDIAQRLDRAISDVENLLAASGRQDRVLRTRLQRIHSDLVQSKNALEP